MPFKKGDPKPAGSGIKKGQKHERTKAEDACFRLGVDPFDLLAKKAIEGDVACIIQLCKHIEPAKKPLEVSLDPEKSTIRIIVEDYGSKDSTST